MSRYWLLFTTLIIFLLGRSTWAGVPVLKIDRVTVKGVQSFPISSIESAIEIYPGQILDRDDVVASEEGIQTFYRAHGYDEMTVKVRFRQQFQEDLDGVRKIQNVLEFDISEGRPIRIAEVELVPVGQDQNGMKEIWDSEKEKLKRLLKMRSGEILDQSKISEAKRVVQETLQSDEFMGAGVSQINFEAATGKSLDDSARWVKIRFKIDLGDRVLFGFRGNKFFTWSNLQTWIEDLRAAGLGKDYQDIVKKRIEDEYRNVGFAKVSVSYYTVESANNRRRNITYLIDEGPRVRIESIDFDGNFIFTGQELKSRFFSRASGIVQNGIYVEKDVRKAAELLTEWMKEKGFLSSRLVTINSKYLPVSKTQLGSASVRLVVYLYEGNQTTLRRVELQGLSQVTDHQAKSDLGLREGEPLNLFSLTEGIEAFKKRYRDLGFLNFQIRNEGKDGLVRYTQENRQADVVLDLSEGQQFRVGRIQLEGLVNTRSEVVLRELAFQEGGILGESAMITSERQLRKLGIFSSVVVRALDDEIGAGKKFVLVKVEESDRGMFVGGPGIRSDLGLRINSQLTYSNLWGRNHTVSVSASANRRFVPFYNFLEGQAQLNYSWPWFLIPGLTFRPSLSVGRTQYLDFSVNGWSTSFAADNQTVSLTWDKSLVGQSNFLGSLTYTFEGIRQFMGVRAEDNSAMTIGTVTPRLTLDLRDNPLLPTSGFYSTAWMDFAPPALGSNADTGPIGYYRVQFRSDYYWPVAKRFGFYFSFRTGYEQSLVNNSNLNSNAIPLIKQFSLGGIASLRGYNELELNTVISQQLQGLSTSIIKGSLSYINYRAQLDFLLNSSLKFDVFLDSASLLINAYGFQLARYGAGCGFRYLTPVGSVNVDWGFKLNPIPGVNDLNVVHFSVGVI
jgi:outer membrane protein insertion porin family